jgi:hypothetical protein
MGVRITLFAVDVPQFITFIQRSVWEWLWQYVDSGPPNGPVARIWVNKEKSTRIIQATPQVGVVGPDGKRLHRLNTPADPLLSCSLHDYLTRNSPWKLYDLLDAMVECPNESVRLIARSQRRWWIGSVLDYAEKTLGSTAPDYRHLASLFQRVLRGYDCGKILPKSRDTVPDFRFPLFLQDDPDLRMGVWTEEETLFVLETIRSITYEKTRFAILPGTAGFPPDTDEAWNQWVQEIVGQILAIDAFPLTMRTVISVIL